MEQSTRGERLRKDTLESIYQRDRVDRMSRPYELIAQATRITIGSNRPGRKNKSYYFKFKG